MEITSIVKTLNKCGIHGDIWEDKNVIGIHISWGDWKHDHWRCDEVMNELGYELKNYKITEENGSDCFSADRFYKKI